MSDEGTSAFRIEVEEDLIAAALEAVEKLERQRAAAKLAEVAEKSSETEETGELDLTDAAEAPGEELAFNPGPWGEPPPSVVDLANQRADAAERALADLQAAAEELRERARRANLHARTLRERNEVLQLRVSDAEATAQEREKALNEIRAAVQAQEAERVRLRQRQQRDLDDARRFGVDALVKELLPALDHLDLALNHQAGEGAVLAEGLRMVLAQVQRALQKVGVERIEAPRGAAFNPAEHEAIQYIFDEELAPGRVAETHQAGYRLSGRLLRAARVAVVRPPGSTGTIPPAPSDEDLEDDAG